MTDYLGARPSGLQPSLGRYLAFKAQWATQATFFPTLKINQHAHFGSPELPRGLIARVPWSATSTANRCQISVFIPQGTLTIRKRISGWEKRYVQLRVLLGIWEDSPHCALLPVFLSDCFYKVLAFVSLCSIFISVVAFIKVCKEERRDLRWLSWGHTKNKKHLIQSLFQENKLMQSIKRTFTGGNGLHLDLSVISTFLSL